MAAKKTTRAKTGKAGTKKASPTPAKKSGERSAKKAPAKPARKAAPKAGKAAPKARKATSRPSPQGAAKPAAKKASRARRSAGARPKAAAPARPATVRWNDSAMRTSQANVANVVGTREEISALFGSSPVRRVEPGAALEVRLDDRIILNPVAAKRLLTLLQAVLGEYEKRFGAPQGPTPGGAAR